MGDKPALIVNFVSAAQPHVGVNAGKMFEETWLEEDRVVVFLWQTNYTWLVISRKSIIMTLPSILRARSIVHIPLLSTKGGNRFLLDFQISSNSSLYPSLNADLEPSHVQ